MPAALAAASCVVALAACGSSNNSSSTTAARVNPGLAFSDCMRSHGVPSFPDPSAGGELNISPQSGVNPRSPVFQAAQRACRKLLPFKGGPPKMSESQRLAAFRFATCMRSHGAPGFPDPMLTASHSAQLTLVLRGMVFTPGPGFNPQSLGFRQAAQACGLRLP